MWSESSVSYWYRATTYCNAINEIPKKLKPKRKKINWVILIIESVDEKINVESKHKLTLALFATAVVQIGIEGVFLVNHRVWWLLADFDCCDQGVPSLYLFSSV